MSLIKKPTTTPARLEASRRNGAKSRGPVTETGKERSKFNALKRGLYSAQFQAVYRMLDENPFEFEQFHQDLIDEWQPSTPTQRRAVRRLAVLFWRQERTERAEDGVIARRIEEEHALRLRRLQEEARAASLTSLMIEPGEGGLRLAPDSLSKFAHLLSNLRILLEAAERGEIEDYWDPMLKSIYGTKPTDRGENIRRDYEAASAAPKPGGASVAALGAATESLDAASPEREEARRSLVEALREELHDVQVEAKAYRLEAVEVSPSLRQALLAPQGRGCRELRRQDISVARQIERELQLLVWLKQVQGSEAAEDSVKDTKIPKTNPGSLR